MNTSGWRRILLNAVWLAGGNASARIATLVALVLAARLLGPVEYGKFAAFQGLALFLTSFAGMGLTTWAVRSLAHGRPESAIVNPSIAIAGASGAVLILGTIVLGTLLLNADSLVPLLLIQMYMFSSLVTGILNAPFWARERMLPTAVIAGSEKMLLLGCIALLFQTGGLTLFSLTAVYASSGLLKVLATTVLLLRWKWWRPGRSSLRQMISVVREAWPFGATMTVQSLGSRLETPLLAIHSPVWAGLFATAFKFVEASLYLIQAGCIALLPSASRVSQRSRSEFGGVAAVTIAAGVVLALPITLIFLLTGESLIEITFGAEFRDSNVALSTLAVGLPFAFTTTVMLTLINAAGRERLVLAISFVVQSIRLIGMALFPLVVGFEGAGFAVFLGMVVSFVLFSIAIVVITRSEGAEATAVPARVYL